MVWLISARLFRFRHIRLCRGWCRWSTRGRLEAKVRDFDSAQCWSRRRGCGTTLPGIIFRADGLLSDGFNYRINRSSDSHFPGQHRERKAVRASLVPAASPLPLRQVVRSLR